MGTVATARLQGPVGADAGPPIRGLVAAGLAVLLVFVAGFGVWSATAPLASAAIARGTVLVESQRKLIQHLEGGIVREILVQDGDRVQIGQVLARLDDTRAGAQVRIVDHRIAVEQARIARLEAERDGADMVMFPPEWGSLRPIGGVDVTGLMAGEKDLFAARREQRESRMRILRKRIAQYREQRAGLIGKRDADEQLRIVVEADLADLQRLVDRGMIRRPMMRDAERDAARVAGDLQMTRARIAQIGQAISELELEIADLGAAHLNEVERELGEARAELVALREQRLASSDISVRSEIRAPIDGTVVNLQLFTQGGVVGPGAVLMELVPHDERLVVDARIAPADIDVVHAGLAAQVRFPAFSRRNYLPVGGVVERVSADRLNDPVTAEPYFAARILLDEGELSAKLEGVPLHPGMQAEVLVSTGERTLLDYLLKPLTRTFERAMREQ